MVITLQSLKHFSSQLVFEYAVKNILEQGVQSIVIRNGNAQCAYRGEDGNKCLFGFFIADNEYFEGIEKMSVEEIIHLHDADQHTHLLSRLQCIHDAEGSVQHWSQDFKELGEEFNLNTDFIKFN